MDELLDLLLRRTAPQAEADGTPADLRGDPHGLEDRRQLGPASVAC